MTVCVPSAAFLCAASLPSWRDALPSHSSSLPDAEDGDGVSVCIAVEE